MTKNRLIKPAVGAVVFKGSDVLLIKRGRPPLKGHWSIPGGKIEYGEPMEEAVCREVREETGVEIKLLGLIDVFEALPVLEGPNMKGHERASDSHYIMIDYVAEWVSGEPEAADDAEAAEFMPYPQALSCLAWDKTRTALQQAKAARARLLGE
jgi:8-oxo-dGTP diphosphatase